MPDSEAHVNALDRDGCGIATVITGLVQRSTPTARAFSRESGRARRHGSGLLVRCAVHALFLGMSVSASSPGVLLRAPFGRYLYAVGLDPQAARLVGLKVDRLVIQSLVVSGGLVGFAGVLQVARQGSSNPQVGVFFLMPALSAAFLGATSIHPGCFDVPGTILAVFPRRTSVERPVLLGVATSGGSDLRRHRDWWGAPGAFDRAQPAASRAGVAASSALFRLVIRIDDLVRRRPRRATSRCMKRRLTPASWAASDGIAGGFFQHPDARCRMLGPGLPSIFQRQVQRRDRLRDRRAAAPGSPARPRLCRPARR